MDPSGMSRRSLLAGATAALPSALLGGAAHASAKARLLADPSRLPSAKSLLARVREMTRLGPRLPGSEAHDGFVDLLEAGFRASGLQIQRDAHRFTRWVAGRRGLDILDGARRGPVRVASAYPYSGTTQPGGVEGRLAYLGPLVPPAFGASDGIEQFGEFLRAELAALLAGTAGGADGRIVVLDAPILALPMAATSPLLGHLHDPDGTLPAWYLYKRAWTTMSTIPALAALKKAGAKGVVFILDASAEAARGQYTSFLHPYQGLPALLVDRDQGTALRQAARSGARARLTLDATLTPGTRSDSLVALLPGKDDAGREPMIVHTHTDGQNAFEENAGIGLLALARYFSRRRLDRTLVFSCVTGHFAEELPETEGFIADHPDLVERAVAALTLEHLGATEWADERSGYHATGRVEPAGIFHTPTRIRDTAIASIKAADLRRSLLLKPTAGFFGAGAALHKAGVPSLAFIAGPQYLIAEDGRRGHLDKFDPARMRRELLWAADTLHRLDTVPASTLRQPS